MYSKDFEKFRFSCFDKSYGATHNGLDVKALMQLQGAERVEAERLILQAIQTDSNSRPILAAGHLKLQSASPILKQRLFDSVDMAQPYNRVHIAWALFQIEKYSEAVQIIVDVLKQTPRHEQWSRMMAVESLGDFGEVPLATDSLLETLFDEDGFIAHLAIDSLKLIFDTNHDVINILNELQLARSGHKTSLSQATPQEAVNQIKRLAGIRISTRDR